MKELSVAICSIVRDCGRGLEKNIPVIEKLRASFKDSTVIVFENDSIDKTKEVLKKWSEKDDKVLVFSSDIGKETIVEKNNGFNKYFSNNRISKMTNFRNNYLIELEKLNVDFDFVIVVDLDVAKININGIYNSFKKKDQWDVVTANGYSFSPKLKKRYHDSYALVEVGNQEKPQTEAVIYKNQSEWAFLKKGLPLIPVYSAFGGLAIYKFHLLKGKRYSVFNNEDSRVEVKCEHFSLHHKMALEDNAKIFINPNMTILYQKVNFDLIKKVLLDKLK